MNERDTVYNRWKLNKNEEDRQLFKRLRNNINLKIKQAKKKHINECIQPMSSSQTLWKNLEKLGICKEKNHSTIGHDINVLNKQFILSDNLENTIQNAEPLHDTQSTDPNKFSFRNITIDEMFMAFKAIKSNAIGPDDIPLKFLKIILTSIAPTLLHIFNNVLTTGLYPTSWKYAKIIPVQKKVTP